MPKPLPARPDAKLHEAQLVIARAYGFSRRAQRLGVAEATLRADAGRIGPEGRDTIALHLAVARKNLPAIRWLIDHGADVNARRPMWDCNSTALHMCAENGALDVARLLLDSAADPNIRDDKYKATALGWAEFLGRDDFAELIRARGGQK